MALVSPARAPLSTLSVNSFGTPTGRTTSAKKLLTKKRPYGDVEDFENSPSPRKICHLSPRPIEAVNAMSTKEAEASRDQTPTPLSSPNRTGTYTPERAPMDIDQTQHSAHASTASSVMEYDGDDTMETQQTAATEVTQSLQLRVCQHLETLRLRLQLAQFKVRTNQTNIPFAQLRLSTASVSPLTRTPAPDTDGMERAADEELMEPSLPRLPASEAATDNAHKQKHGNPPFEDISSSPPLSPTAHGGAESDGQGDDEDGERIGEAPERNITRRNPIADEHSDTEFRTPELPRSRSMLGRYSDMEMPHFGAEGGGEGRGGRGVMNEEERLTSSAIKGNAAIGLLGLRGTSA